MLTKDSNILIVVTLSFYLNILVISPIRYNQDKIVQENPKIYSSEFSIDDRILNLNYYDACISELKGSEYNNAISYEECPTLISGDYESNLLFIDLPPPEYIS